MLFPLEQKQVDYILKSLDNFSYQNHNIIVKMLLKTKIEGNETNRFKILNAMYPLYIKENTYLKIQDRILNECEIDIDIGKIYLPINKTIPVNEDKLYQYCMLLLNNPTQCMSEIIKARFVCLAIEDKKINNIKNIIDKLKEYQKYDNKTINKTIETYYKFQKRNCLF